MNAPVWSCSPSGQVGPGHSGPGALSSQRRVSNPPHTPLQAQGATELKHSTAGVSTLGSATYKLNGFERVSLNLSKP